MPAIAKWFGAGFFGAVALIAAAVVAKAQGGTPHFWPQGARAPGEELQPPAELGGFPFGEELGESRDRCRRAGHRFSGSGTAFRCTGAAGQLGFEAALDLAFCAGRLCEIKATLEGPGAAPHFRRVAEVHGRLFRVLTATFGAPQQEHWRAPAPCRQALEGGGSAACFSHDGMRARHWWSAGGHELYLGLQRSRAGETPELTVMFRAPERLAEISATSD